MDNKSSENKQTSVYTKIARFLFILIIILILVYIGYWIYEYIFNVSVKLPDGTVHPSVSISPKIPPSINPTKISPPVQSNIKLVTNELPVPANVSSPSIISQDALNSSMKELLRITQT